MAEFKSYMQVAKQHQKPKPYQKHEQFHHEQALGRKEPEEKPLSEFQVDQLFWNKLVQLGWRLNTVENNKLKSIQLMFTCQDCGKGLHTQQSHTITLTRARAMYDQRWLDSVIKKHKTSTNTGCNSFQYDENGEAIAEA